MEKRKNRPIWGLFVILLAIFLIGLLCETALKAVTVVLNTRTDRPQIIIRTDETNLSGTYHLTGKLMITDRTGIALVEDEILFPGLLFLLGQLMLLFFLFLFLLFLENILGIQTVQSQALKSRK